MIFIDASAVPEKDQSDIAIINSALKSVEGRRQNQIDCLDEPYIWSKIAWKVALFSNAMVYRFAAIADGTALSWNSNNALSAILNARALVETVAVYWEFSRLLKKYVDAMDFEAIDSHVMHHLFSTRDEQILNDRPELKAKQVLNAIDAMDKLIPHFRSHYDRLSERCHPNSAGHRVLFSALDRETGIAAFKTDRDDSFILPIKCALGTAGIFERAISSVESNIVTIAAAHRNAHPSAPTM